MKFMLQWLSGKHEVVEGDDIADAFRRAGLGGGSIHALDYYEPIVNLSGLYPGCKSCQDDGMREHYAGVHLCFHPPQRTALVDPSPKPFRQPHQVWSDWIKSNLPTEGA